MFLQSAKQDFVLVGIILLTFFLFPQDPKLESYPKCDGRIVITIDRSSCFGRCPVYSAEIHGDGTVVYVGKSYVMEKGERRSTISPENLQQLIKEFRRINYFSLEDRYETDENGNTVSDLPTTTTSICLDGRKKTVVNYAYAPREVHELQDKIDSLAGLNKFIAGRP
jgi:hypothetical protein